MSLDKSLNFTAKRFRPVWDNKRRQKSSPYYLESSVLLLVEQIIHRLFPSSDYIINWSPFPGGPFGANIRCPFLPFVSTPFLSVSSDFIENVNCFIWTSVCLTVLCSLMVQKMKKILFSMSNNLYEALILESREQSMWQKKLTRTGLDSFLW